MKKRFTQFLALSGVMLLMLASCKKDENRVVVSSNPSSGTLSTSATTISLSKATLTNNAITFTTTKANFGYNAVITNTLQLAIKGTNFATTKDVILGGTSQTFTVQDFNNMLLALNLHADTAAQVDARIKYSISNTATPVYSNTITLNATPFSLASWLYVVGSFEGWNLANVDSIKSATSNGIYTGVVNFTAGNRDFLILPKKTTYDNKYATNDPVNTTSSTVAVGAPNNLFAPTTAGKYLITLDINANTISFGTPTGQ